MLDLIKMNSKLKFIKFTSRELLAICPVNDRPDHYELIVEFSPKNHTLEIGSLREYLLQFQGEKIFAENLCEKICCDLYTSLNPVYLSVKLIRILSEYNINIEVFQQMGQENKS